MQSEPTARQKQVLAYFERKISLNGRPPSLRQAALEMGVSHAAIAQALRALEDKGYVKRGGHYSREVYILNRTLILSRALFCGSAMNRQWLVRSTAVAVPKFAGQNVWIFRPPIINTVPGCGTASGIGITIYATHLTNGSRKMGKSGGLRFHAGAK